jgi:REP element-mobilizing transposase RayT
MRVVGGRYPAVSLEASLNRRLQARHPYGMFCGRKCGIAACGWLVHGRWMGSTHASLLYHLVFATKGREPWLRVEWRARLHEYLGGLVRDLGGVPQGIGGVDDHVHLLVGLKPVHCLADFMRELKKASSRWVGEVMGVRLFRWQEGYGAFTVGVSVKGAVQEYIARQEEHHRRRSFREEYVAMLRKAGVEFDERYLE